MPAKIYVNGKFYAEHENAIRATDRGFTLGDGIFETMLAVRGEVLRRDAHLARLRAGAKTLKIPLDADAARAAIDKTLAANGLENSIATVRLTLTRGVSARGLALSKNVHPTLVISAVSFAPYPAKFYRYGMHAVILQARRNEFAATANLKLLNYVEGILGKARAIEAGAQAGIFLNTRAYLAESCVANLFWMKDETLFTPSVGCGIVPGILRATVLNLARQAGIATIETQKKAPSLIESDEAFLTNTLMGVMPLTRVDAKIIGQGVVGKMTKLLQLNLKPQMPIHPDA